MPRLTRSQSAKASIEKAYSEKVAKINLRRVTSENNDAHTITLRPFEPIFEDTVQCIELSSSSEHSDIDSNDDDDDIVIVKNTVESIAESGVCDELSSNSRNNLSNAVFNDNDDNASIVNNTVEPIENNVERVEFSSNNENILTNTDLDNNDHDIAGVNNTVQSIAGVSNQFSSNNRAVDVYTFVGSDDELSDNDDDSHQSTISHNHSVQHNDSEIPPQSTAASTSPTVESFIRNGLNSDNTALNVNPNGSLRFERISDIEKTCLIYVFQVKQFFRKNTSLKKNDQIVKIYYICRSPGCPARGNLDVATDEFRITKNVHHHETREAEFYRLKFESRVKQSIRQIPNNFSRKRSSSVKDVWENHIAQ